MSGEETFSSDAASSSSGDVRKELDLLLAFCPSSLQYSTKEDVQTLPSPSFYDGHLDPELQLEALKFIPSLHLDIAKIFQRELLLADSEDMSFPPASTYPEPEPDRTRDGERSAPSIGSNYMTNLGSVSQHVAALFCLLKGSTDWPYLYSWLRVNYEFNQDCPSFSESYSPTLRLHNDILFPKRTSDALDKEILQNLYHIEERFPKMAVWQMFALTPEVQHIFEEMENVKIPKSKKYPSLGLLGSELAPTTPLKFQSDSDVGFIGALFGNCPTSRALKAASKASSRHRSGLGTTQPRRSSRLTPADGMQDRTPALPSVVIKPAECSSSPGANVLPDTVSIIRHAWVRAVETDSTFIVFHAGNFERIGIRHRGSRTLFLSKLIRVDSPEGGLYGALHVGLHMCIIKDLLNRIPRYLDAEAPIQEPGSRRTTRRTKSRKATRGSPRAVVPKQTWTRSDTLKELRDIVALKEIISMSEDLNLIVLRFQSGVLNSASPVKCLRLGTAISRTTTFKPKKYLTVLITGYCGGGATGEVHKATIRAYVSPKQSISCKAVVKLAFSHAQRKKMRREWEIYQFLFLKRVSGIPLVLGVFQDIETRALAMIMQDVGQSVLDPIHRVTSPSSNSISWVFTDAERDAFVKALTSIHSSGVRHRDIRPENLMLSGSGRAYIIDFDKALLNASEESREEEMEHLEELLYDGWYTAPHDLPTLEQHPPGWREPSGISSPP